MHMTRRASSLEGVDYQANKSGRKMYTKIVPRLEWK